MKLIYPPISHIFLRQKAAKLLEEDDDSADNTSADLSMESEESSKIVLNGVVHPA